MHLADNPADALALLQQHQHTAASNQPLGIITGSLYTAGEILNILNRAPSS
jgi:folylpolyglutamate synthase/dihydropteroate synthase